MSENAQEKYIIAAVVKAATLENWLAGGELLEWRSLAETAQAQGLKKSEAYRLLKSLVAAGRVEESDKGWRISPDGVIRHSFRVAEYFRGEASRFGL